MKYKVQLAVPVTYANDCRHGYYIHETNNLKRAIAWAKREASNILIHDAIIEVLCENTSTIHAEFPCATKSEV